MKIQVESRHHRPSLQLRSLLHARVHDSLQAIRDHVRRVHVRLDDLNGPKGGVDTRCSLTLELVGAGPIHVQYVSLSPYSAVAGAAGKASRAGMRILERRFTKRRRSG